MAGNVVLDLGSLRQVATLSQAPFPPTNDGSGGFTETPVPLNPATWRCSIESGTRRAGAETRLISDTILSNTTHIFHGRFHDGITNRTIIVWTDRAGRVHTGNVLGTEDTDGAGIETVAFVSEITR